MTNLHLHILLHENISVKTCRHLFICSWNVRYHRVEVRLSVNEKSNKWTLPALCSYCNCMWFIVQHMSHSMFSLSRLIANMCNWVDFIYTEVNLRYYLSTIYIPKECMFLVDVWYKGSKKTILDTYFTK